MPSGTTVKAAHGGTVVKAGPNGAGDGPAYGNAVVIKHGNGTYSQYAHLSRSKVKRRPERARPASRSRKSGNTGNSTGPHLHFEIRTTAELRLRRDPVRLPARQRRHRLSTGPAVTGDRGRRCPSRSSLRPRAVCRGHQLDGDLEDGLALLLGVAFDVLQGEHPGVHGEQRADAADLVGQRRRPGP